MKKTSYLKLVAGLILVIGLTGCATLQSWFDWDGNGRIDPLAYLASADVTIGWEDANGVPFSIATDENGLHIEGQFTSPKTGLTYGLTEDGGFTITDPNGFQIQIKQKE